MPVDGVHSVTLVPTISSSSEGEVLGSYLNHLDQGKRITAILSIAASRPNKVNGSARKRQFQNHLTQAQSQALLERYRSGSTVDELPQTYNVHGTTVVSRMRKAGIPKRPPKMWIFGIERGLVDGSFDLSGVGGYRPICGRGKTVPCSSADPCSGALVVHCHDRNRSVDRSSSLAALVRT